MTTCDKCGDVGKIVTTSKTVLGDGRESQSSSSELCDCRKALPALDGRAAWWSQEQVYGVEVRIPIFDESVSIRVDAEVPVSADNYRVTRRGNRYYATLINIEGPKDMTLHSDTARTLARALLAAAEAAEKVDDADTDPRCGHWAPCDCAESAKGRSAGDPHVRSEGTPTTRA